MKEIPTAEEIKDKGKLHYSNLSITTIDVEIDKQSIDDAYPLNLIK